MTITARRTAAAVALSTLVAMTLAGCGGDDDGSSAGDTTTASAPDATSVWVTSSDGGKVFEVDIASGGVSNTVDDDLYPVDVAAGFGAAWVVDGYGGVRRIDPDTGEVTDIKVTSPNGIVVGDDAVWVATKDPYQLVPIDPETMQLGDAITLPKNMQLQSMQWLDGTIVGEDGYDSNLVAVDTASGDVQTEKHDQVIFRSVERDGTVYFSGFGGVLAVDGSLAETDAFASKSEVTAIAADTGSQTLWTGYSDGTIATLDPETGTYGEPVKVGDDYVGDLEYVDGVLWASIENGPVLKLDPATLEVQTEVALPRAAGQAALAVL